MALRPAFHEGESFSSVIARGAAQRGVPVSHFRAKMHIETTGAPTPHVVAVVETALGFGAGALAAWTWTTPRPPLSEFRNTTFRGSTGITQRVRVCPDCLADDRRDDNLERNPDNRPWLRAIWSVIFITCCPVHGVRLVDTCRCGTAVACTVPLDVCGAGHMIAAPAVPVEPDAARLSIELSSALAGSGLIDDGPLAGLSWIDGGRLALRLGALGRTGRAALGMYSAIDLGQLASDCGDGRRMIAGIPGSFEEVLDRAAANEDFREDLKPAQARDRFGNSLKGWLKPVGHPLVDGLWDAFDAHRRRAVEERAAAAAIVAAAKPAWKASEAPGPRFHSYVAHVPGEEVLDRVARGRAMWATLLTDTEVERLADEGVEAGTGITRLDALHIARRSGLVISLVGVATALNLRLQQAGVLVDAGILPTAWAPEGTAPVCYRSDVADLSVRLHSGASRSGAARDDMSVATFAGRLFGVIVSGTLDGLPAFSACEADGVAGLFVSRFDLQVRGLLERCRPDAMSWAEFCDAHDVLRAFLAELVEEGLVVSSGSGSFRMIKNGAAETFARRYVSARALARTADVPTMLLSAAANRLGVTPAYFSSNGRLFHRSDMRCVLDAVTATKIADRPRFKPVVSAVSEAHPWRISGGTQRLQAAPPAECPGGC